MAIAIERRYPSPLRYPGGKGKLANFIKLVFLRNDLVGREYVEPYAGGASVALSLLFEDYASHVHINDIDRGVYTLWRAILEQSDALCERIGAVRVTTKEWHRQRAIQDAADADDLDLAFSTFFLNRTSRSGIIRGGIIGGYDQTGPWKIDARFTKDDLIRRIKKIARHRNRITVTGIDAADYLTTVLPGIEAPFLYLDPPYYVKGSDLYPNFYWPDDHRGVAAIVRRLRVPWIVSYDAAPDIEALYGRFAALRYELSYSAAVRQFGSEMMFFSPGLKLPPGPPANVPVETVNAARRAG